MVHDERREFPRTEVALLVLFPGGRGETRDISSGGLCLVTDGGDALLGREIVPLEIHLERKPPFSRAVVAGDGAIVRMRRFSSDTPAAKTTQPRWEVGFQFQRRMEVCDLS